MSDFTTFEELSDDRFLNITVATDYGDARRFRLKLPGFVQWSEIFYAVKDAPVPNTRAGANGKEPNVLDADYREKQAKIDARRKLLLVAWALSEGGMTITGATLDAKADALGAIDGAIVNALFAALKAAYEGGVALKDADGATFRALRALAAQGNGALRAFADGVGAPERALEAGPDSVRAGTGADAGAVDGDAGGQEGA